ncbi:MAG: integrase [Psychromonas sp.]|jgi:integrase|uniref:site-specific integrase n=1 Tax=Psychromonas sp. TaxID=1884585 RepID=UPI0039E62DF3
MNLSLIIHKNLNDESDVCIVDENYLPACFFLSSHMKTSFSNNAFNTRLTYGKIFLFIHRYFIYESIDLVKRVELGEFLTAVEYDKFKRHCTFKVDATIDNDDSIVSFERFSNKQLDNLVHSTQNTVSKTSSATIKLRLIQFLRYIEYLYQSIHSAHKVPVDVRLAFSDFERWVKTDLSLLKIQNTECRDPFEKAIPDDLFFKLLGIIKPSCNKNPYKSSRFRNQLIMTIFIETGIRVGALAKLKISDIKQDWDNPRLMITRTPNDPTDPRKIKAAQKTKPHASSISHDTLKLLNLYIKTQRTSSKFTLASSHDFIFISEKGESSGLPITTDGIYKAVKVLGDALDFDLHPHLFRHKWNELFDTKATEAGYSQEKIEDIRKYAMGWSESSTMSRIYNEFKYTMKIHELSVARQKESVPIQGKNNGS